MNPCILYGAKSTEDRHDSIGTQLEDCREMAAENGWTVVDEYFDEGFSAYSGNRGKDWTLAQEHAVRLAAETGEVCMLVAQAHDRFARGAGDKPGAPEALVEIWHRARRLNVHLRTVEDDFDMRDSASVAAIGQRAHVDSRRKSKSVRKGMKRLAKKGQHHGGPRTYGFTHESGGWHPVEAEQEVVRRIDREFLAGKTLSGIARDLSSDGVVTVYKKRWRPSTVRAVLANPVYAGWMRAHGEDFEVGIERCRSVEDHQRIREMLGDENAVKRGRLPTGNYLFRRGMLRCECGWGMTSRTDRRYGHERYICQGRSAQGSDFCDMPGLRRDVIDSAVYRYFEQVGLDMDAIRRTVAEARDGKLAEVRALRDDAEREANRANERLSRVRRDYTDGKIDADEWRGFRDDLGGQLEAATAEARRFATKLEDVEAWSDLRDAEAETWRRLAEIREAIAGRSNATAGIDAVRAALIRTFEHFVIRRSMPRVHVELIAGPDLVIEPVVREQAIEGYSESMRPILHREALDDVEGPAPADAMFAPIKVVSGV